MLAVGGRAVADVAARLDSNDENISEIDVAMALLSTVERSVERKHKGQQAIQQ